MNVLDIDVTIQKYFLIDYKNHFFTTIVFKGIQLISVKGNDLLQFLSNEVVCLYTASLERIFEQYTNALM